MTSRLETNFTRLLCRCEAMASEKNTADWRLEKYVETLQNFLSEMRKLSANKPAAETITEYTRSVDFLKGLIEAEKLPTPTEKVHATELLNPTLATSERHVPSRQLHVQTRVRYHKEMRDELIGDDSGSGVRQRHAGKEGSDGDIDSVLRHHSEMQEKLAEEMVHLARNLKENAKAANRVVKDDTKKLDQSNKLADGNFSKLKVESDRLETHVQRSCNCWIWVMLVLVCATFVWMVIFMRLFPKR